MNKKKEKQKTLSFKDAVEKTPEISSGYKAGLSALGSHSKKIIIPEGVNVGGSVDIDKETVSLYPGENRWDYAFSCNGKVYYVEVHSANTSEVSTVIRKLQWLKSWLATKAPELVKLTDYRRGPFYWIQSSNFQIPPHCPQYKKAISNKLLPIKLWEYSKIVYGL